MPQKVDKKDGNNGISENYTRLALNMAIYVKQQYTQRLTKDSMLPRLLWVNKNQTLKQLHLQVFEYLQHVLCEWLEWKDPETKY